MSDVGASALRDASLSAPPKITWNDIAGDPGGAKVGYATLHGVWMLFVTVLPRVVVSTVLLTTGLVFCRYWPWLYYTILYYTILYYIILYYSY
jgi:hypothetical protein